MKKKAILIPVTEVEVAKQMADFCYMQLQTRIMSLDEFVELCIIRMVLKDFVSDCEEK